MSDQPEKCYSTDGESFTHDTAEDAFEDEISGANLCVGESIVVFEGDKAPHSVKNWIPDIAEEIGNRAYEDASEWADSFPDCTPEQSEELQREVETVVLAWLERHSLEPTFYRVENIKEIRAEIVGAEGKYQRIYDDVLE